MDDWFIEYATFTPEGNDMTLPDEYFDLIDDIVYSADVSPSQATRVLLFLRQEGLILDEDAVDYAEDLALQEDADANEGN